MTSIKRYIMENCPNHDTCWDIAASPDGYIYVGACMEHTPGGIAELVQFDTKAKRLKTIAILAMMEFLLPVCRDKFITIFRSISNFFDPRKNSSVIAHECIEEFRKLIVEIKVEKPLKVVNKPDIELLSEYSIKHLAVDRIPRVVTKKDFVNLYQKIFSKNYF